MLKKPMIEEGPPMNNKNILHTIAVAAAVLLTGYLFIDCNNWLGYTDSAILYLAAVVGAGCYWIGINLKK